MSVSMVHVEAVDGAWSLDLPGDSINVDKIEGIAIGKLCADCQKKLLNPQDGRVALCRADSDRIAEAARADKKDGGR